MDMPVIIVGIVFLFAFACVYVDYLDKRAKIKQAEAKNGDALEEHAKQMDALKERVAILEEIVVDKSYQVKRDIEKL